MFLAILLLACAPGLLDRTVADGIPVGLVLALIQPPVIGLAVALHDRAAVHRERARADDFRERAEPDPWRGALR
ncbi:DUF485 domain-containing protein [Streptomyces gramineus]|uniref:DUF485 domain-containing protein n=1 Tax=Streptomyces gramineus TaxID=910542 RepID=UPI00398B3748